MKKILVPTDFSPAARKALELALIISEKKTSEITLLHCYQLPVVPSRHIHMADIEEAKQVSMQAEAQLGAEKEYAAQRVKGMVITESIPIYMSTEIASTISGKETDLIVMGTYGSEGLKKFFLGSNTASVIASSQKPVLAVPSQAQIGNIKTIGFAYDHAPSPDCQSLQILSEFSRMFGAHTEVFHINSPGQDADKQLKTENLTRIQELFSSTSHDYTEYEEGDLETGIYNFISGKNIDLLAMLPRNRSIFQRLFRAGITRKIVFSIPIPLLAIPAGE